MSRTGDDQRRDELLAGLLPPALEVMTAWSLAEDGRRQVRQAVRERYVDRGRAQGRGSSPAA